MYAHKLDTRTHSKNKQWLRIRALAHEKLFIINTLTIVFEPETSFQYNYFNYFAYINFLKFGILKTNTAQAGFSNYCSLSENWIIKNKESSNFHMDSPIQKLYQNYLSIEMKQNTQFLLFSWNDYNCTKFRWLLLWTILIYVTYANKQKWMSKIESCRQIAVHCIYFLALRKHMKPTELFIM